MVGPGGQRAVGSALAAARALPMRPSWPGSGWRSRQPLSARAGKRPRLGEVHSAPARLLPVCALHRGGEPRWGSEVPVGGH